MLQHLVENWKSTVANLLTLVIVTGAFLLAQPPATLAQMHITHAVVAYLTAAVGLAKIYVGLISKDSK